jgi:Mitochondrial carrier protein
LFARKQSKSGDDKRVPVLSAAEELAIGVLAGAVSRFFTTPFSCITVRNQTWENESNDGVAMAKGQDVERAPAGGTTASSSDAVARPSVSLVRSPGFWAVAKGIYDEGGIMGFWNGFQSACLLVRPLEGISSIQATLCVLTRLIVRWQDDEPGHNLLFVRSAQTRGRSRTSSRQANASRDFPAVCHCLICRCGSRAILLPSLPTMLGVSREFADWIPTFNTLPTAATLTYPLILSLVHHLASCLVP